MLKDFKNSVKKKKEISVAEHVFTSWNLAFIAPGTSTNSITRQLFFFSFYYFSGLESHLPCFASIEQTSAVILQQLSIF